MTASDGHLLLRADVEGGGRAIVAHAVRLTADDALIATNQPFEVGAEVTVMLSFPRLVQPLALVGRVTAIEASQGPGESSGMWLKFVFANPDIRQQLVSLLSSERPARVEPYRVLLIEDNALIRNMFAYGLRKYFLKRVSSVTVDQAESAEVAWEMLLDTHYDLVIVDFYLPGINGATMVSRMRSDANLATIPVVAISVGGEDARVATLAAGADLFLAKPIVLRDLFSTLEHLTAGGGHG